MHGREGEERKRRRHMWPVPALGTTFVAADSTTSAVDFFCKDGRKISVGDCALFKPPQESPPFIGIIRWLTSGKEDNLKLGVNWLYRPAEVKLGKGILLEAAPNEVFYSFHKDEIPAASLLHPCKVAFLRKGVELPSGISSFVCRRVYDIANRCLWWLTDQDYINERQEEVDQLLDRTRLEMHAGVQSGGRSPKPLNGPTSTPQLKHGSDSVQNSATSLPSQVKGKKRERGDRSSEHIKCERSLKTDDGDFSHFRMESLKSEIAKITDKGGLVDIEGVEKLVQLMQPDRAEKKIDLVAWTMLANVLSATDRCDCLGRFVQLRGLPVLDEWLQEVHKGKTGDGSSPKDSDKSIDEFLLSLLRALDKLPVNLNALQNSHIGKSVNTLRSHKNLEIQKKARSLVDTWKKRVEAEMKINDAKSGSSQTVSWPTKHGFSEVSHGGSRRTGGPSEVAVKSSITQPSVSKIAPVKVGHGEALAKFTSVSPGSLKVLGSLSASVGVNLKDSHSKMAVGVTSSDMPLTTKEEKSSSSSQSQNNSQSCSSDHAKTVGSSWKEDARSSTAGSMNKVSSSASRHRNSGNGYVGSSVTGAQKETSLAKCSSSNRYLTTEKVSQSGLTCERAPDVPLVDHGNSHRLIVRFPNPGRSPARSASGSSFEEHSMVNRVSSPGRSEKHDSVRKVKGKSDVCRANIASDVNMESWQSNDVKEGVAVSDEGDRSPATVPDKEQCRTGEESLKLAEASKAISSWGHDPKLGKPYEAHFCSINALIESCIKYSEAGTSMEVGDDMGMDLLASVAAGEMSKSDMVSPVSSPGRNSPVPEDSCTGNDAKLRSPREDDVQNDGPDDIGTIDDTEKQTMQGNIVVPPCGKDVLDHPSIHVSTSVSRECTGTSSFTEENAGEHSNHVHSSSMDLQPTVYLKCDGNSDEIVAAASFIVSSAEIQEGPEGEGASQVCEQSKVSGSAVNGGGVSDLKSKAKSPLSDENKEFDSVDDKIAESGLAVATGIFSGSVSDACDSNNPFSSLKFQKEVAEESPLFPLLAVDGVSKNGMREVHSGGTSTEQKPPASVICSDSVEGSEVAVPSGSGNVLATKNTEELKAEAADDMEEGSGVEQSEKHMEQDSNVPPTDDGLVGAGLGPAVLDNGGEGFEEKSGKKEEVIDPRCDRLAPQEELPANPVQESEQCLKSSRSKLNAIGTDETQECASIANASSSSVTLGDDMASKLDFDLNEGFPVDDGNPGDPTNSGAGCSSAIHLPSLLPFPVSSMSGGLPASITVAAAAKGPFVPPENLLRNKAELGWKGSAATSAFRPAEPRKVLEMPLSTTDISHITASKQGRPLLDIDLNIPDERVHEDMDSQSAAQEKVSDSGPVIRGLARGEMFGCSPALVCNAGGLDLDLNRIDEGTDIGQIPSSTSQRLDVPFLPTRSSSVGFSNGEVNVLRNFDLNNGPVLDEVSAEPAPRNQHSRNSVPFLPPVTGLRMTHTELGNLSSWFPPGNSYSAITIPSILPERGEQPYSFVAAAGSQRIMGPPSCGSNFGPDVYRGSVFSSSPSAAFPPATSFQYPGFPFGANFPLPSTSFSGVSTCMDSSSGAALCFPAVPSPLVAPAGPVSPHFPRPYVISLSDATSNGGAESSRKWGRQSLDLNAGPGGMDVEGRNERFSLASRQLSVATSQALAEQARMYQAAGGVLKRKEPEGGWDTERFSYKQSSLQ